MDSCLLESPFILHSVESEGHSASTKGDAFFVYVRSVSYEPFSVTLVIANVSTHCFSIMFAYLLISIKLFRHSRSASELVLISVSGM